MKNLHDEVARSRSRFLLGATGAGLVALLLLVVRKMREATYLGSAGHSPRVLILGAGFGGLTTAAELARALHGRAQIVLVDRNNYHLFTPLLFQVSTCGIDPYDIACSIRGQTFRRRFTFRKGTVAGIDLNSRSVHAGHDARLPRGIRHVLGRSVEEARMRW